jgi:hypothetical protein
MGKVTIWLRSIPIGTLNPRTDVMRTFETVLEVEERRQLPEQKRLLWR